MQAVLRQAATGLSKCTCMLQVQAQVWGTPVQAVSQASRLRYTALGLTVAQGLNRQLLTFTSSQWRDGEQLSCRSAGFR